MTKLMKFTSMDEYEVWTESFEDTSDWQYVPAIIDNGHAMMMDLFTECKRWQTALRRFEKLFTGCDPEIKYWIEGMVESCENGTFEDHWRPGFGWTKQETEESRRNGTYSWGVESPSEGLWYVYLNISGCYADREPMIA